VTYRGTWQAVFTDSARGSDTQVRAASPPHARNSTTRPRGSRTGGRFDVVVATTTPGPNNSWFSDDVPGGESSNAREGRFLGSRLRGL